MNPRIVQIGRRVAVVWHVFGILLTAMLLVIWATSPPWRDTPDFDGWVFDENGYAIEATGSPLVPIDSQYITESCCDGGQPLENPLPHTIKWKRYTQ